MKKFASFVGTLFLYLLPYVIVATVVVNATDIGLWPTLALYVAVAISYLVGHHAGFSVAKTAGVKAITDILDEVNALMKAANIIVADAKKAEESAKSEIQRISAASRTNP